ncbi:MAG: glycosyltransferase [Candidatus Omnitrophica bacterium]|nr:glycosyltransferase [Candidatus Omnitrophota bacterium]
MRTVLYVETGTGFGGSAQNLATRLQGLDRARFRPIVVAYHDGGAIRQIRALGVPIHIMPPVVPKVGGYLWLIQNWLRHEWPRTRRLIRLIRREHVDLVHTNNDLYSSVAPLWAAKLTGRPVICHLQLTRTPTALERRLGRWADRLVAVTRHAHDLYRRSWPAERLEVVYDAVQTNGLRIDGLPALRQDLGFPPAAPVVGLLARCVPGKGYEEFLRAAAIVRAHEPSARFLIVGNGPGGDQAHEAAMRRLADALGLTPCVAWGGWRNDTARILHLLSVVVQASSTFPEGLSRVLLEAMAYGRPVVATSLPTTCEAVVDGQTGLLARPGDPQALAEAIVAILKDRALAERLGGQGRARVAERFSVAAHAAQVMRLYDNVLNAI